MPKNHTDTRVKLSEMGTSGLVHYAVTGDRRMRGARTGRAKKVIALRHKSFRAVCAFVNACNAYGGIR